MKKLLIAAMLVTGLSAAATAQTANKNNTAPRMTAEQRAQMQADKMNRTLNLSAAQKQQVYNLNLQMAKTRAQSRTSIANAMKQRDAAYQGILTPAQYKQYQTLQNARLTAAPERATAKPKGQVKTN